MKEFKKKVLSLDEDSEIKLLRIFKNIASALALVFLLIFVYSLGVIHGHDSLFPVDDYVDLILTILVLFGGGYLILRLIMYSFVTQFNQTTYLKDMKEISILAVEDWILNSESKFKYPLNLQAENVEKYQLTSRDAKKPSPHVDYYNTYKATISGNNGLKWEVILDPTIQKFLVNQIN